VALGGQLDSGPVISIERQNDLSGPASATPPARPRLEVPRPETPPTPEPPKLRASPGSSTAEIDFSDLSLDLEPPKPKKPTPSQIVEQVKRHPTSPRTQPKGQTVGVVAETPDMEGDFADTSPIHILYKLAVDKTDGLLVVEISAITKEIYLTAGTPEYVSSNVARELLGEYLVSQKVISAGELAMALAMMPHFGGKLGDTLVGLGLMKPLDVFRHLTRQVRDKIIDVCTWQKGHFRFYKGKRNAREAFPLGLDAFEVLGAGASALSPQGIESCVARAGDQVPIAVKTPRVVPEAFRLGSFPRDVWSRLDKGLALRDYASRFTDGDERAAFLRTLYLLVQTELVTLT
jgi:hypothetical protein